MQQVKYVSDSTIKNKRDEIAAKKAKAEMIVTSIATVLEFGTGDELTSYDSLSIAKIIDFSKSTIHRKVNLGEFPAPIYLSPQMKRWRMRDIKFWLLDPTTYKQRCMKKGVENE